MPSKPAPPRPGSGARPMQGPKPGSGARPKMPPAPAMPCPHGRGQSRTQSGHTPRVNIERNTVIRSGPMRKMHLMACRSCVLDSGHLLELAVGAHTVGDDDVGTFFRLCSNEFQLVP